MCDPEVRALQDALLSEEALAVLEPGHDALGRPADRIEDRLLRFGLRQQRFELVAREAEIAAGLLDERAHLGTLQIERGRGGDASEAEQCGENFRQGVIHLETSFFFAQSDMRIPKPAMRVTIAVPP